MSLLRDGFMEFLKSECKQSNPSHEDVVAAEVDWIQFTAKEKAPYLAVANNRRQAKSSSLKGPILPKQEVQPKPIQARPIKINFSKQVPILGQPKSVKIKEEETIIAVPPVNLSTETLCPNPVQKLQEGGQGTAAVTTDENLTSAVEIIEPKLMSDDVTTVESTESNLTSFDPAPTTVSKETVTVFVPAEEFCTDISSLNSVPEAPIEIKILEVLEPEVAVETAVDHKLASDDTAAVETTDQSLTSAVKPIEPKLMSDDLTTVETIESKLTSLDSAPTVAQENEMVFVPAEKLPAEISSLNSVPEAAIEIKKAEVLEQEVTVEIVDHKLASDDTTETTHQSLISNDSASTVSQEIETIVVPVENLSSECLSPVQDVHEDGQGTAAVSADENLTSAVETTEPKLTSLDPALTVAQETETVFVPAENFSTEISSLNSVSEVAIEIKTVEVLEPEVAVETVDYKLVSGDTTAVEATDQSLSSKASVSTESQETETIVVPAENISSESLNPVQEVQEGGQETAAVIADENLTSAVEIIEPKLMSDDLTTRETAEPNLTSLDPAPTTTSKETETVFVTAVKFCTDISSLNSVPEAAIEIKMLEVLEPEAAVETVEQNLAADDTTAVEAIDQSLTSNNSASTVSQEIETIVVPAENISSESLSPVAQEVQEGGQRTAAVSADENVTSAVQTTEPNLTSLDPAPTVAQENEMVFVPAEKLPAEISTLNSVPEVGVEIKKLVVLEPEVVVETVDHKLASDDTAAVATTDQSLTSAVKPIEPKLMSDDLTTVETTESKLTSLDSAATVAQETETVFVPVEISLLRYRP